MAIKIVTTIVSTLNETEDIEDLNADHLIEIDSGEVEVPDAILRAVARSAANTVLSVTS